MYLLEVLIYSLITNFCKKVPFYMGKILVDILRLKKKHPGISKKDVKCVENIGCLTLVVISIFFFVILYLLSTFKFTYDK